MSLEKGAELNVSAKTYLCRFYPEIVHKVKSGELKAVPDTVIAEETDWLCAKYEVSRIDAYWRIRDTAKNALMACSPMPSSSN
jgi:hypothetical protein